MAQTGKTPIVLYHSTVASAVPSNANLQAGELAMNIADMKLYAENSGGTVTLLASADAAAGNFTTVDTTNLEVTNIKAKDGTAAIVITDSTGAVTVSSPFATTGNTTLGNASGDTVTVTGTITSNLIFTDNTYDIGASGATRPRNLFLAGNATIGGSIAATTLDLTNLEVTNIKAKDGTASATIADSTGVMTIGSSVLTTTDINGGTIDATAIGGTTPAAGAFTTLSATSDLTIDDGAYTSNRVATIKGGSANGTGPALILNRGATQTGLITTTSAWLGGANASSNMAIATRAGYNIEFFPDNTTSAVGTFSSTGLAVTGTIESTSYVKIADASDLRWGAASAFIAGSSATNTIQVYANTALVAAFTSTGLAVTGAVTASSSLGLLTDSSTLYWGAGSAYIQGSSASSFVGIYTGSTLRATFDNSGLTVAGTLIVEHPTSTDLGVFEGNNVNGGFVGFRDGAAAATRGYIGYGATLFTGGDNTDFGIRSQADLLFAAGGGTVVATISTTGLAVTGYTSATTGYLATGEVSGPRTSTAQLGQPSAGTSRLIAWGPDNATAGIFDVAVLSANAGVGSIQVASFSSTGLAVTGNIDASGSATIGNGSTNTELRLVGDSAANSGAFLTLYKDATRTQIIGQESVILAGGSTSDDLMFYNAVSAGFKWNIGSGTPSMSLSSAGVLTVAGGTITTGSTTALSLATSGGTQVTINNLASTVNSIYLRGSTTTAPVNIYSTGSDTNVGMAIGTQGSGSITLRTDVFSSAVVQAAITHTASANRYITLTGSNGGNPTISTSAGSLAITPNIVCSGAVYTGNNANAGIENVYNGAVAANANLDLPIHVKGGLVVIRDNSSGGIALALVDEATGVTIVSDPTGILATADPGAGGNKFWLQCSSGGQYTRITNRFGVSKAIGFSALSSVMV